MVIKTTTFYRKECHLFSYASHVLHSLLIVLVKGQGNQENQYGFKSTSNTDAMAPRKAIYVVLRVILNYWYDIRKWYLEALGCPGISCTACPWTYDPMSQKCPLLKGLNMWTITIQSEQTHIFTHRCFILNVIFMCNDQLFIACKWVKVHGISFIHRLQKTFSSKRIFHGL